MSKRCWACGGTGDLMGSGMMLKECHHCDGYGTLDESKTKKVVEVVKVDKRSKSYKEAIDKIMRLHPDYTREQAVAVFDSEFDKIA